MVIDSKFNVELFDRAQKMINRLEALRFNLDQSELNIGPYIETINECQEFSDLMSAALPDWHCETKEEWVQIFEAAA